MNSSLYDIQKVFTSSIVIEINNCTHLCFRVNMHALANFTLGKTCNIGPTTISSCHGIYISSHVWRFITGLPFGNPSLKLSGICSVLFFFSSVSVKVLPVTPLVSGIFVHRAFCAYFPRIERVVELRRFLWWTQ